MLLSATGCMGGYAQTLEDQSNIVAQGLAPDPNATPEDANQQPVAGQGNVPAATTPDQTMGPAETDRMGEGNYVIGSSYTADADMQQQDGVAKGSWCQFTMTGTNSKFYTGNDPNLSKSYAPVSRKVYVYVPAKQDPKTPLPLMVGNDGSQAKSYFTNVLDNLIAKKTIPPMAAVCIDNGGGDAYGSERGLEYDVVSEKYGLFVNEEVLPMAASKCNVTFTTNPAGRAAFGTSSGAAAAMSMGWFHPELYSRIITYSATLVDQWSTPQEPNGAWAYPGHLISENERKNLRIFLCVGSNDLRAGENNTHDWVLANKTMAKVLAAKGYHYQFYFAQGGSHVDRRVIDQTLPSALTFAWRGYPLDAAR